MALPDSYGTYDEYFDDILDFFKNYQFLYNYANTDILVQNVLKDIPDAWLTSEEKNVDLLPDYKKILPSIKSKSVNNLESDYVKNLKCLSTKKLHEICNFSEIIGDICIQNDVSFVIDLGCGLGYLSQLLNDKYKFNVLGIEGDINRVNAAINRQNKYYKSSISHVSYVQHFITAESATKILEFIQEKFPQNSTFYLIGLHACADLTIDAIKLFLKLDRCKGLAIMPCCYHRMQINELDDSESLFFNMPLSESLKSAWKRKKANGFIRRPFLRLACQRISWMEKEQDIQHRVFHLLSRAVLQLYASLEGLKVSRKKRKAVSKQKSTKCDFPLFLQAVVDGYNLEIEEDNPISELVDGVKSDKKVNWNNARGNLLMLWNNLSKRDYAAASVLIEMQDALQALGENLILLDKLAFLHEQRQYLNIPLHFEFVKVTDEKISPRCYALLTHKTDN